MKQKTTGATLAFHWSYIVLPLVILILSIILTIIFYFWLSGEVAYHFKPDGSPDRWVSRGAIILWMLLPQIFLTLIAAAATWGITKLSTHFRQSESTWIKPARIVFVMGNMIAMPQIILFFAMLDILSYNSYQIHLLPLSVFALIIMGLGSIMLAMFFVQAIRRA